jgi:hypothetical protein
MTRQDLKIWNAVVAVRRPCCASRYCELSSASKSDYQSALGSGERQMPEDWFTLIVGKGNVNEGLLRVIVFIVIFIGGFGTLFWWLLR